MNKFLFMFLLQILFSLMLDKFFLNVGILILLRLELTFDLNAPSLECLIQSKHFPLLHLLQDQISIKFLVQVDFSLLLKQPENKLTVIKGI